MPKLTKALLIFVFASPALACSAISGSAPAVPSAQPSVIPSGTALPAPANTAAPASTSTAGPQGSTVSFNDLSLTLPANLASGTTNSASADVEFPYINPSAGDMPEHTKMVLNGYQPQGTVLEPQVLVFPAAAYAQYTDLTGQIISTLQGLQYTAGQPLPQGLPAGQFSAQVLAVKFTNGRGLRYLTQFDQAPLPVNNRELIYYFHGLTNDGSKYVEVILPIQAPFLAPDENPSSPLPTGGIPFAMDQFEAYLTQVAQKLDATSPDQFSPSLGALDALVQSISIH